MKDLADLIHGYRWNYLYRCIMETREDKGYSVDFCRYELVNSSDKSNNLVLSEHLWTVVCVEMWT